MVIRNGANTDYGRQPAITIPSADIRLASIPGRFGKGRTTGAQRYYCQSCKKTFQTKYIYKANEALIAGQVTRLISQGNTPEMIGAVLQVNLTRVHYYITRDE